MTSDPSKFYDSRLRPRHGAGYPSCNTELCRLPRNTADPHGYYREIGVNPWATPEEIKAAVRRLYRKLHPDTGFRPDPDRLQRVKLIAEVLLDPIEREKYNHTPAGKRLLDKVYRSELSALNILDGMTPEQLNETLRPVSADPVPPTSGRWFDYLAVDRQAGDMHLAQHWYAHLLRAARVVGYRRRIKVMIHNGPPFYHPATAVMAIPRHWTPSSALAFALFIVEANWWAGKAGNCQSHGVA